MTHKLNEALQVSDRITVLRGGKLIGTIERNQATPQKIARMMVDRYWIYVLKASSLPQNAPVILNVRGIRCATEYVRKKLIDPAQNGIAVLLVSSDLDEILELSHRILVMFRGEIVGDFPRDQVGLEQLGLLMAGHGRK